jgi:hypothetical protein
MIFSVQRIEWREVQEFVSSAVREFVSLWVARLQHSWVVGFVVKGVIQGYFIV